MPTERRFDITAFFKSFSSEKLERFFPLGNPVVKLVFFPITNWFQLEIRFHEAYSSQSDCSNIVSCFWPGALQLDLNINYAISTRLDSVFFRSHPYGCKFYLILYSFGFAAVIEKWAPISFPGSVGEYDDILPCSISKTIQIKFRDKLDPVKCLEPDN